MRALDHVDRVDLDIAEVLDRGAHRAGAVAEGRRRVEPLGMQPEPAGVGGGEREGRAAGRRHGRGGAMPRRRCQSPAGRR